MKIVGYTLDAQDNDAYMFEENALGNLCPVCKYRRDFFATNPDYRLRKRASDLSATYDGQLIVSHAFKLTCERFRLQGVEFDSFKNEPDFFHLQVTREIAFDAEHRHTRFINRCDACGNYESIVGASPAYLKITASLSKGFFRTDLLFGSGNEKSPIILVGLETKMVLEKAKLTGLEFAAAYGMEDLQASVS